MSVENIRNSMEKTISYLKANPEKAKIKGKAATAVLESGLKVRTTGPKDQIIVSDIPSSMGGGESAPAPGWYMQAALAACYASGIALKAAQESIELSTLEVSIDAESDARGFFGFDEAIKAGPLNLTFRASGTRVFSNLIFANLLKFMKILKTDFYLNFTILQLFPKFHYNLSH